MKLSCSKRPITDGANTTAENEGRPYIQIWDNTNLHDYDDVLDRMKALPGKLALSGIHLCKQLGPSFCGLVVVWGSVYLCMSGAVLHAPCCDSAET